MNYLSKFSKFSEEVKIHIACRKWKIKNYTIRDGLVDVDGNVNINFTDLSKLPIKFGIVSGDFDCSVNKLITLEGSPIEVVGKFICSRNRLNTLKGSPKEVVGSFDCNGNDLTTLEGGPKVVGRNFNCAHNDLTTLEGGPKEVGGYFYCGYNNLTTLEHIGKIGGDINLYNNPLPKEILRLSSDQIKKVVKEQDFYEIWRNGKLFEPRWRELKIDLGL